VADRKGQRLIFRCKVRWAKKDSGRRRGGYDSKGSGPKKIAEGLEGTHECKTRGGVMEERESKRTDYYEAGEK